MTDKAREEFEAWLVKANRSCASARNDSGGYSHYGTQSCWEAWQASREALVVEFPVFDDYPASIDAEMRESLRVVIEAAGLKVAS